MNLRQYIDALCARVLLEVDNLTRLDQAVGDGDFGTNIERGVLAIRALLSRLPHSLANRDLLLEAAKALNAAGCGTSGTLLSFGMMSGALRGESVTSFCESALNRIKAAGKAQLGEKTLVDALGPAVDVLRRGGNLAQAALAAAAGATKTKEMLGTKGRSFYSQSRAAGIEDPGAYLIAALFDEAARQQAGVLP